MQTKLIFAIVFAGLIFGLFLFWSSTNEINIAALQQIASSTQDKKEEKSTIPKYSDIAPQNQLKNPPKTIKAVYVNSWSAGNSKRMAYIIDLIKNTELNAVVFDVKDVSGYVAYNTELELPHEYNAVELRIPQLNKLIKRLHDEGIYAIARITVFKDGRLSLARPDLALVSSSTRKLWKDYRGEMWMDPAAKEVWDYNLDIAQEVLSRGVDEVNFDYIRFASDGNLDDIVYPKWDGATHKTYVLRDFFKYIRERLPTATISIDLFGLTTVNTDDLGIGQYLEFAIPYFDVLAPMVYPSHYFKNFIGFKNPAEYPYEVVKYSLDSAYKRISAYEASRLSEREKQIDRLWQAASTTPGVTRESIAASVPMPKIAKMRPWLQNFDLGADYTADMVRTQIQAVYDSATSSAMDKYMQGWMLWNAGNKYTAEALQPNR